MDGEQGNGPSKSRCEAMCRELHGTGAKNSPFRALDSTPSCLFLPSIWGAVGGDFLGPLYLWDHIWASMVEKEMILKTLKDKIPLQGDPNKKFIDTG
jgi:hypothetical protein